MGKLYINEKEARCLNVLVEYMQTDNDVEYEEIQKNLLKKIDKIIKKEFTNK